MLVINRGENNIWILTLTELSTLSNPKFLFKIKSDMNSTIKCFIAEDLSSFTSRYNQFLITETNGSEILTSGTVSMNPSGFWHYEVYEQISSTNLDPSLCDNQIPLEYGRLLVIGDDIIIKRKDENITYKGYGTGES